MRDIQTEIGTIQIKVSLFLTIIQDYVKTAGQRDDKFIIRLECMPVTITATRDIIKPIGALDSERNVRQLLDKRKIPSVIFDLGQIDDSCRKLHTYAKFMNNFQS